MSFKTINCRGRTIILLLFLTGLLNLNTNNPSVTTVQAASGTFTEDFTTTTYMDGANTNATGWGTGSIENSKKKPTIVGSISSSLIGNTLDVFVDGDYAYVTNEDEGLKVVNITDPTNPNIIGSYITTSTAQSVFADGDYIYVADSLGDTNFENFLILDITDPTNPTHLGNCSTYEEMGDSARDVVVDGDTAFIANNQGGLYIVDVTNLSNPSYLAKKDTVGISTNLVIEGNYVYLADGTNGLVVMNITNPLNPTIAAAYKTGIGCVVDVVVEGNYAYIIDRDTGVIVLNIIEPTTPTFAGLWSKIGVSDAYVYGDYLYVTDINDGLSVVNITNPTNPNLIYTIPISGVVQSIVIDGIYAYLACHTGGFQIVQIADYYLSFTGSYDTLGYTGSVVISGDYAYIADGTSGLQVLDINIPSSPTLAGSYDILTCACDIAISGDYAYIADYDGLRVLDISDSSSPTFVGSYDPPERWAVTRMVISGDYAYLGDDFDGIFQVINIRDPSSPTLVGSYDTTTLAYEVFISGDYAYLAASDGGLLVLDISTPSSPTLAGSYNTPYAAFGVFISGDYAYVADGTSGLQVLDISIPSSPTLVGSYDTPDRAIDVFVSGDYAYIADYSTGLLVLNVSTPSSPTLVGSYDTPGIALNVVISGDYAYVADGTTGLQIIEVRKNRASQFVSSSIAQSTTVFSSSLTVIEEVILIPNNKTPTPTSINYYLSVDNGINWELVTPGIRHNFIISGYQLKWKIELITSDVLVTPMLYNLSITYNTILIATSLDTPTDNYISEDYTPTFTWLGINGESSYLVQLDTDASFITPLLNITVPLSSTSYTPTSALIENTYCWRVAGIDSEGDLGTFSNYRTLYIIQDTNVPIINNPNDISYELGSAGNNIIWSPTDSNPYWYNITLNGFLTSHNNFWTGGNIVFNVDGLSLGTYIAVCRVYDLEGLMISDTVIIEVDPTAPPTMNDVADVSYEEGTTGHSLTWHPTDGNPDYYTITRDGTIVDEGSWSGGDITVNIDSLAYGAYSYVCTVNDTEGQEASDTVTVSVTDNVAPILNSPSDVIYDEGDTGNNIVWTATDNNPTAYIIYRNGMQVDSDSWSSGSSIIISVDGLSAASYNYTIVVFDEASNSAKDEVIVAVMPVVTEFNQNTFWIFISIIAVFVFYYKSYRKGKKT